jgi:DNA-binding transcriptional ArsR family regulator
MVSHQLRTLRSAGLVTFRRDGKLALYRLIDPSLAQLMVVAADECFASSAARR